MIHLGGNRKANGITEGKKYAILTNEIYKEWLEWQNQNTKNIKD